MLKRSKISIFLNKNRFRRPQINVYGHLVFAQNQIYEGSIPVCNCIFSVRGRRRSKLGKAVLWQFANDLMISHYYCMHCGYKWVWGYRCGGVSLLKEVTYPSTYLSKTVELWDITSLENTKGTKFPQILLGRVFFSKVKG